MKSEDLQENIETILSAEQEVVDSLDNGPVKNQINQIRKIAENKGEKAPGGAQ